MAGSRSWFTVDAPATWSDLLVRTVRVALVAFVVLQLKEFKDAGRFDTGGTAIDGLLIGAGSFLLHLAIGRPKGAQARFDAPGATAPRNP